MNTDPNRAADPFSEGDSIRMAGAWVSLESVNRHFNLGGTAEQIVHQVSIKTQKRMLLRKSWKKTRAPISEMDLSERLLARKQNTITDQIPEGMKSCGKISSRFMRHQSESIMEMELTVGYIPIMICDPLSFHHLFYTVGPRRRLRLILMAFARGKT